jgi:tetratricopeptide (TPR) repeat protein
MRQEGKKTASTSISAKYSRFAVASSVVCALAISPVLVQKIAFDIRMNNAVGKLWPSDAGQGPTDPNERQLATSTILDTYGEYNYDPQYTLVVAKTFRNWNEKDLALKFAQEVLAKEPRSFDAWNLIASVYENSNEIKEALPYRLKSISLDPNNYELKLLISQDYFLINDFNASQSYLSEVLREAPQTSSLYKSALTLAEKLQEKKS